MLNPSAWGDPVEQILFKEEIFITELSNTAYLLLTFSSRLPIKHVSTWKSLFFSRNVMKAPFLGVGDEVGKCKKKKLILFLILKCACHGKSCFKNKKITWYTVTSDLQNESKLLLGVSMSSKLKRPPNICIPSRANISMNKESSSNKLAIDLIEFTNDSTRLLNDSQYLEEKQFNWYTLKKERFINLGIIKGIQKR